MATMTEGQQRMDISQSKDGWTTRRDENERTPMHRHSNSITMRRRPPSQIALADFTVLTAGTVRIVRLHEWLILILLLRSIALEGIQLRLTLKNNNDKNYTTKGIF